MSWKISLRLAFIACLLVVFINYFALPSVTKYLDAGVIREESFTRRTSGDWPSLTICRYDKESTMGWKNRRHFGERGDESWIDQFCGEPNTIDEAFSCFQKGTFSLSETVINGTLNDGSTNVLFKANHFYWREDLTESTYYGKILDWMKQHK